MDPRLVLTCHEPSKEAGAGTDAPAGIAGAAAAGPAVPIKMYQSPKPPAAIPATTTMETASRIRRLRSRLPAVVSSLVMVRTSAQAAARARGHGLGRCGQEHVWSGLDQVPVGVAAVGVAGLS